MTDGEHVKQSPEEAHREGLELIERQPHHATTQHDKPAHEPEIPAESPAEKHRAAPFPRQTR